MSIDVVKADDAHRTTVATTFGDVVRTLQETLGTALVAELAGGVDPKTVGRWVEGQKPRREAEDRVRAAFYVLQLLLRGDSDHTVRAWFIGMNPQLDDVSPIQALRDGEMREVVTAARSFTLGG